jgi:hypothetical protein
MDFKADVEIARLQLKRLKQQREIKKNSKLAITAMERFDFSVGITYAMKAAAAQQADDILADQVDRLKLLARTPAELHTYVGWTCPGG